jgi:HlyD family secretion protein
MNVKKLIPVVILLIAAAAFYFRGLWLPAPAGQANYLGYVEGETVMIAAPQAGRVSARPATKGAAIRKGETVFSLDTGVATAELARAEAAVQTAQAQLDNLLTGKRDPELNQIRAQRREAEASLALAKAELLRALSLTTTGTGSRTSLDQAQSTVSQYEARIAQFQAAEAAARLAARGPEIEAARSKVKEAEASAKQAQARLAELSPAAPVDALVENTFFEVGEWVGAGQPVVSLLPPNAITLHYFVPEAALAKAQPGTSIHFTCDGCGPEMTATITHVETSPEFSPPVIYSQGARAKLVFLVEARPDAIDPLLRPGLPIEVEPTP